LVQIKGRDVNVSVKTLPCGNFEASVDVDGEKKVCKVDNNFTLVPWKLNLFSVAGAAEN
jgi:hypothetical protein